MYLRAYRTTDLPSLYELDNVCFEPPFRFSRDAMRRFAEAKNAIVRVACEQSTNIDEERIVGFCIVHLEDTRFQVTGYVVTLDVDPGFRRQGIGPALMRSVEAAARDAGAHDMALHVWVGNEAALRLYAELGYEFARTAKDFYAPGLDALVYRKALDAGGQGSVSEGGEWRRFDGSA